MLNACVSIGKYTSSSASLQGTGDDNGPQYLSPPEIMATSVILLQLYACEHFLNL